MRQPPEKGCSSAVAAKSQRKQRSRPYHKPSSILIFVAGYNLIDPSYTLKESFINNLPWPGNLDHYPINFVCDAVDGWCARKFNQVSTFGAVLDMVTDRISTACLLVVLSHVYKPGLIFLSLLALDIASHWLQMYSTFLSGKASHNDVKDSTNWLFKLYYGNRMFMAYCCVSCEVLYLILFVLSENHTENLIDVLSSNLQKISIISFIVATSLFGWAIKQVVNIIQMKTAADACVLYDINGKQKH